jgi:LysM repeat protein
MSTPNPLAPQGSLLEKHGRGRSTFQIISFIGALHVVALCGMLWIGCKKDDQAGTSGTGMAGGTGGLDAGTTPGLPPSDPGLPPIGGAAYGLPYTNDLPGTVGGPVATAVSNPPITGVGTLPPPGTGTGLAPLPTGSASGGGLPPVDNGAVGYTTATLTATSAGEYKVQSGDTGTKIASKAGVKLAALKAANPGVDWNKLKLNQTLVIPAPTAAPTTPVAPTGITSGGGAGTAVETASAPGTTYTVRPGDNGMRIAKKTGVTWKAIRAANGLTSDNIRPGQKLKIPAKGGGAAATPSGGTSGGGSAIAPAPSTPSATPLPTLPGGQ